MDLPPPTPRPALIGALLLAALVVGVYAPVREHAFVSWDDPGYVAANPHVSGGLSGETVGWALSAHHMANWHPLTWLSHALDWELFGDDAGGHHMTSVVLHAAAAALLLIALTRLTGSLAVGAVAATLFAVHPLRVESVAWVSERKDVLSGLFFAAVLLAWERHARAPTGGRYATVLVLFVLGLASKPMLVTLPALLVLLDVWPLRRWRRAAADDGPDHPAAAAPVPRRRLLAEQLPLWGLAAASAVTTLVAQDAGKAIQSLDTAPLAVRLANAPLAVWTYLRQTVWPGDLAFFVPHPAGGPQPFGLSLTAAGTLAAGGLLLVTLLAVRAARRGLPAPLVGWLWFLGLLVPVVGLVQVGVQGTADRYTYLPGIGLGLALGGGLAALLSRHPRARLPAATVGLALVVALAVGTRRQLATWRDSETLYSHALAVTEDNYVAHTLLGAEYLAQQRLDEAAEQCDAALAVRDDYPKAHYNRGLVAALQGDDALAREHLQRAVALRPQLAAGHATLGTVLERLGDRDGARRHWRRAVQLDPTDRRSQRNLQATRPGRDAAGG